MYDGAPDECSYHFVWGYEIVTLEEGGKCPREDEHTKWGPASHFA